MTVTLFGRPPFQFSGRVGVAAGLVVVATSLGAQQPKRSAGGIVVHRCQDSLPAIYERLSPAVVSITATSINPYDIDHRLERTIGSGMIIDSTGLILTNSHVVFERQVITVTLDDGTTLPARLVGADPIFDVALVKISATKPGKLPVAQLGNSDRLRIGAEVYAIGNPLGLDQTLTRGIVSATNRLLPDATGSLNEPLIQTDAAINPGNSGGPLVDRCGEVVGITTAILSEGQNIGFAVPIRLVQEVIPELISHGHIVRPWLGIHGQFVPPTVRIVLRVDLAVGFLVETVEPGSPADQAGLRGGLFEVTVEDQPTLLGGDVITEMNGIQIDSPESLQRTFAGWKVGSTLHLTLLRGGERRSVDVTAVERPLRPGDLTGHRTTAAAGSRVVLTKVTRSF